MLPSARYRAEPVEYRLLGSGWAQDTNITSHARPRVHWTDFRNMAPREWLQFFSHAARTIGQIRRKCGRPPRAPQAGVAVPD
eukprot:5275282-Prymnesium_polylepis.1